MRLEGIPNKALKLAAKAKPDCFTNTFESKEWKRQK